MWVHSLRGALWLVVHDAAVGVQGEWETAVKPLHGLIEGRQTHHDREDAHRARSRLELILETTENDKYVVVTFVTAASIQITQLYRRY